MTTATTRTTRPARTFDLGEGLTLTVDEQGDAAASGGSGVLLLHGGAGPRSVAGLAAALSEHAYVLTPTHPGFDGRPRPDWVDSVADLAEAYLDLLDVLGLNEVIVIGSSIGGWIAAEMALRDTRGRLGALVLLNATGILVKDPREIADTRSLSPAEIGQLAFHNPAFRLNPAALSDAQRAALAANQQTLQVYAGDPYQHDPKLRRRLHRVTLPALVLWGEQDGIASVAYGRAYADAFADGRFQPVAQAGHFPHIEQLAQTLGAIREFTDGQAKSVAGVVA
ncbi:alpha/beta fold hydrolase [Kitasatospora kifunensis]|uniref:Pimeloyl-ACP methyl ester carboxylesterase n=1 Tax=Kitasatospora kifunensis TaxID=58351 RepID=A0A7W7QX45_KITKI|nr:alpha/beta hydrolase [Kitasatospora kifunensis]MBB4921158.1 pimeloyl-ACP methyl ester carboxylesterase [Kitasatospora kifunensis]